MNDRVSKFKEIFLGLERAYGTFQPSESFRDDNKAEGKSFIHKQQIEDARWEDHLKGSWPSLGIFPINDEDKCRWGCIDIDQYPLDHVSIVQKLKEKNLPFVVAKSKSGGAHLFLFFKDYVPAGAVQKKIKELASLMGLGHCEVFPKQDKLIREGMNSKDWEVGSFLNLPYHNGFNFSDRHAFSEEGNTLSLDEFLAEVEKKSITLDQLKKLSLTNEESEFKDAPFCIEAYLTENKQVQQGSRDSFLFQYAVYAKKKYGENYEEEVHKFHHKYFADPLTPKQLDKIVKQADKKDWGYKCKDQPMCSYCNKSKCRIRKYGVGDSNVITDIGNVVQHGDDADTIYHVTLNDEHRLVLNVEELYDQHKFRKKCLTKIASMPSMMNRDDWDAFVLSIVSKAIKVAPDFEVTPEGQFKTILNRYISNQANAMDIEEILNGQCFVDEEDNKVYFRLDQLQEFMKNRRYAQLTGIQLGIFLRELGGDSTKRKLGNKKGQLVWWVPNDKFNTKVEILPEENTPAEEPIPF